jgi:hypothetical protein
MKKILCALLSMLLIVTALTFVSCGKEETLEFGLGVYTTTSATSAEGDADGKGKVTSTFAVVTLDAEGKIVACELDTADYTVNYTADGKAVATDSFRTKYEKKFDYNMTATGSDKDGDGVVKEWFEQTDAFEALTVGKTLDEVKALVAEGGYGTDDVVAADCTMNIDAFVKAIEKACANATASEATASSTLYVASSTEQSLTDATEEKAGTNQLSITIVATAIADGKIVAASSDCVQVKFGFDTKGASTYDATAAFRTKKEQGTDYNMAAFGSDKNGDGIVKEWDEQAALFDEACLGKTVAEVVALMAEDGYPTADLQTACCTMNIAGFVEAVEKMG